MAALLGTLALISCGGGGTTVAGVDVGGTGAATFVNAGPITGSGSIFLNGVEIDDSTASIVNENGVALTPNQLLIGIVARATSSAPTTTNGEETAVATAIATSSELEGLVQSVNLTAGSMVVLGQTVLVTPNTWFDAALAGGLSVITPNSTSVEVYAQYHPVRNAYVATRVVLKTGLASYKIRGPVTSVDPGTSTLTVGGLTVNYAAIPTASLPVLTVGRFVRVRLETQPVGTTWTAITLVDGRVPLPEKVTVRFSGRISNWASATQFRVDDIGVDAAQATLAPPGTTAADIVLGARVQIDGTVSGGIVTASAVTYLGDETAANSIFVLHGPITALDTTSQTLMLKGITVHYAGATLTGGSAATLAVGTSIKVTGPLDASATAIVAHTIVFE